MMLISEVVGNSAAERYISFINRARSDISEVVVVQPSEITEVVVVLQSELEERCS